MTARVYVNIPQGIFIGTSKYWEIIGISLGNYRNIIGKLSEYNLETIGIYLFFIVQKLELIGKL